MDYLDVQLIAKNTMDYRKSIYGYKKENIYYFKNNTLREL